MSVSGDGVVPPTLLWEWVSGFLYLFFRFEIDYWKNFNVARFCNLRPGNEGTNQPWRYDESHLRRGEEKWPRRREGVKGLQSFPRTPGETVSSPATPQLPDPGAGWRWRSGPPPTARPEGLLALCAPGRSIGGSAFLGRGRPTPRGPGERELRVE